MLKPICNCYTGFLPADNCAVYHHNKRQTKSSPNFRSHSHCPMSGLRWLEISPRLSCWPWTQATPTPKKGRLKFPRTINLGNTTVSPEMESGRLLCSRDVGTTATIPMIPTKNTGTAETTLLSWQSHPLLQSSQL